MVVLHFLVHLKYNYTYMVCHHAFFCLKLLHSFFLPFLIQNSKIHCQPTIIFHLWNLNVHWWSWNLNFWIYFHALFLFIRPKEVVLFLEIDQVKIFNQSPACIVECVSVYIFLIKKKQNKNNKKTKNVKETEEKRISDEMRYCLQICLSWIFPGCSSEFNIVYLQQEKSKYLLY